MRNLSSNSILVRNIVCALLCILSITAAHAQVPVVTYPIPVHVENESTGLFIDLVRAVAAEAKVDIRISVQPPPRALQNFQDGSQAVLFPALDVLFPPETPIVRTAEAIDCKQDFVFTRKGTPLLTSLSELTGKRVGITRGYPYAREVTESTLFKAEAATTDEANIMKLVSDRLDAFILDEKTGVQVIEKAGLVDKIQYDPKRPVSSQEVYYAFQNTPEGKRLAVSFSQALQKLKQDGRYEKITTGITFGKGCVPSAKR